jgi:hypothetical protein
VSVKVKTTETAEDNDETSMARPRWRAF